MDDNSKYLLRMEGNTFIYACCVTTDETRRFRKITRGRVLCAKCIKAEKCIPQRMIDEFKDVDLLFENLSVRLSEDIDDYKNILDDEKKIYKEIRREQYLNAKRSGKFGYI